MNARSVTRSYGLTGAASRAAPRVDRLMRLHRRGLDEDVPSGTIAVLFAAAQFLDGP